MKLHIYEYKCALVFGTYNFNNDKIFSYLLPPFNFPFLNIIIFDRGKWLPVDRVNFKLVIIPKFYIIW